MIPFIVSPAPAAAVANYSTRDRDDTTNVVGKSTVSSDMLIMSTMIILGFLVLVVADMRKLGKKKESK